MIINYIIIVVIILLLLLLLYIFNIKLMSNLVMFYLHNKIIIIKVVVHILFTISYVLMSSENIK